MQRTPQLRTLPLLLAAAFYTHHASAADDAAPANADGSPMQQVEVTAAHLKSARIDLSPNVGTTVYSIDRHMIEQLGRGDNTPFNEVLLRLPGVSQDSKGSGSIHVRDDHANVQYRVNGVQLPESITGFGQSIDTRFVQQTDFITGALPAQFGLRTSGIVDIQGTGLANDTTSLKISEPAAQSDKFSGLIDGVGQLILQGTGTLTTGAIDFSDTGGIQVLLGTLVADGAVSVGTLSVSNGATFGGVGPWHFSGSAVFHAGTDLPSHSTV